MDYTASEKFIKKIQNKIKRILLDNYGSNGYRNYKKLIYKFNTTDILGTQTDILELHSYHRKITQKVFEKAKRYGDILYLYQLFLEGQLPSIPNYLGPLNYESLSIKKQLLEFNKLGILTFNSQPGTEVQRAFLECYVPKDHEIFPKMNKLVKTDFIVQVTNGKDFLINNTNFDTWEGKLYNGKIPVTFEVDLNIKTSFDVYQKKEDFFLALNDICNACPKLKLNNIICFRIIDNTFNQPDFFHKILDILKSDD